MFPGHWIRHLRWLRGDGGQAVLLSVAFVLYVFPEDKLILARIKILHCYKAVSTGIMRLGKDKEVLRKKKSAGDRLKLTCILFFPVFMFFSLCISHVLLPSIAFTLPSCHYTLPIKTLTHAVSLREWKVSCAENCGVIWCHCKKTYALLILHIGKKWT